MWRSVVILALAAGLSTSFGASAKAGGVDGSAGGSAGKAEYCTYCHGPSGRGFYGYYMMPRLAGQSPEYITRQLRAFIAGERDKSLAVRLSSVHGISPTDQAAVASYFGRVQIKASDERPRAGIAEGKRIFDEGLPENNVPACIACHGPEARGGGSIPRLAGQLYGYTRTQLANWNHLRGEESGSSDVTAVMSPIASNMTKAQIDAVAAYISSMK